MAGVTAAWELSRPGWRDRFRSIALLQRDGVLGGKGASVRDAEGRILEHGLHVWPGYYDNAFRVVRECYAELGRATSDPDCPVRGWTDAFVPAARDRGLRARRRHGRPVARAVPAERRSSRRAAPDARSRCADPATARAGPGPAAVGGRTGRSPGRDRRGSRAHRRAGVARRTDCCTSRVASAGWITRTSARGSGATAPRLRRCAAASCGPCTTSCSATRAATRTARRSRRVSACSSRRACSSTTRVRCSGRWPPGWARSSSRRCTRSSLRAV